MPACPSSTELWLLDKQSSRAGISEPVVLASFEAWRSLGLYLHHFLNMSQGKMQLPLGRWEGLWSSSPAGILWHGTVSHERHNRRAWNHHTWLLCWFPVNVIDCNKLKWDKDSWERRRNLGLIFLAYPGSFWIYETGIALGFAKLLCTYLCTQPTLKSST